MSAFLYQNIPFHELLLYQFFNHSVPRPLADHYIDQSESRKVGRLRGMAPNQKTLTRAQTLPPFLLSPRKYSYHLQVISAIIYPLSSTLLVMFPTLYFHPANFPMNAVYIIYSEKLKMKKKINQRAGEMGETSLKQTKSP